MTIRLKRAYEEPAPDDGFRVLVDRLWPRGVSKEELAGRDEEVAFLKERSEEGPLTLVYAAKDTAHNNAVVLRDYLAERS